MSDCITNSSYSHCISMCHYNTDANAPYTNMLQYFACCVCILIPYWTVRDYCTPTNTTTFGVPDGNLMKHSTKLEPSDTVCIAKECKG